MSRLLNCLHHQPGVAFASQYVLAQGLFNSFLTFHNYFDEVFPGKQINARLEIIFHDAHGREVLFHEVEVAPGASTVVDCKLVGLRDDGIMAVRAVPQADLRKLAKGQFKIRNQINTGFYVTWDWGGRFRDTMHEWADVSALAGKLNEQLIGFAESSINIEHGLVMMNPSTEKNHLTSFDLSLYDPLGRRLSRAVPLPSLPAMGSCIVKMLEIFPDFYKLLTQHGRLVLGVNSDHAAPPLTAEWHTSGDFHFHHI